MLALYLRISAKDQSTFSLISQREKGISFATENHLEYRIYEESVSTFGEVIRPLFTQLVQDVENKIIDQVWAISQDRLFRHLDECHLIERLFRKYEVIFYENGERRDLRDSSIRLAAKLKSVLSGEEIENLRERTMRGKRKAKDDGKQKFPFLYGYEKLYNSDGSSKYEIVDKQAQAVKYLYNRFLSGIGVTEISKELNQKRYPNSKGIWTTARVSKILRTPLYCGYQYDSNNKLIRSHIYEAIISLDEFLKVREEYKKYRRSIPYFYATKHLLTSVLFCSSCQGPMRYHRITVRRNGERIYKKNYFVLHRPDCVFQKDHNDFFRYPLLNTILETCFFTTFSDRKQIQKHIDLTTQNQKNRQIEVGIEYQRYQKMLQENTHRIDNLLNAVAEGNLLAQDIKGKIDSLRDIDRDIHIQISQLEENTSMLEQEYIAFSEMYKEDFVVRFIVSNETQKRQILKSVLKGTVSRRQFNIRFVTGFSYEFELFPYKHKFIIMLNEKECFEINSHCEIRYLMDLQNDQKSFLLWIENCKRNPNEIEPFSP